MADNKIKIIISADVNQLKSGSKEAENSLEGIKNRFKANISAALDFSGAIRNLLTTFSVIGLVSVTKDLIKFADNLRLIEGRVKNTSANLKEFSANSKELIAISLKTGTSLEENATMFSRINPGIINMGGNAKDSLRQVDLLAKAMRLSNTAQSESASVIRQWSQAMASGLLRGDEFNSMMENAPRISQAIAAGLRVNIGVLRQMAEAGQLTAVKVGQALVSQGKVIDAEFKKIPLSIGVAMENVKTAFGIYIAEADKSSGATAGIAEGLQSVANNIRPLINASVTLAKALGVVIAGSVITSISGYIGSLVSAVQASRLAAQVSAAHTEALVMNAEANVQAAESKKADLIATQSSIVAARQEYQAKLATTQATVRQTQARVALLQSYSSNQAIVASTNQLTAAEQAKAAGTQGVIAANRELNIVNRQLAATDIQTQQTRAAELTSQKVAILARREELKTKVADANATIAQTQARLALLRTDQQAVVNERLLTIATADLTKAEQTRNVVMSEMAVLGRQQASVNAQIAASDVTLTAATAELTAAQQAANTSFLTTIKTMGVAGVAMAALNLAMAGWIGYMVGDWLNSFKVVRDTAARVIHALKTGFDDLIYTAKKFGLTLDLAFTFDEAKKQNLKKALKELDDEFIANAQYQKEALDASLQAEPAIAKEKSEIEGMIDAYRNLKSPQQVFIEKSRELDKELAKGTITVKEHAAMLQNLKNAMQMDIEKNMTPFEKEQADLADKRDKATLSPEEYQRKQYLKKFSPEDTEKLMANWTPPEAEAKKEKDSQKSALDSQLAKIKLVQDELKQKHDYELKLLDSQLKEEEFALNEQVVNQIITEEQKNKRLIELQQKLAADKLAIEEQFLRQQADLDKQAITEKIKAAEAETVNSGSGKGWGAGVYSAFAKQGLSRKQALAMTAEVGRENDFNPATLFGSHTDLAKRADGSSITNTGFFSWEDDRAEALKKHLQMRGVWKNGKIEMSQRALDAQAEFAVLEMKSSRYKSKVQPFLENENIDSNEAAKILGKGYVGWAYGQDTVKQGGGKARVPFDWKAHDNRRAKHYQTLEQTTGDGDAGQQERNDKIAALNAELKGIETKLNGDLKTLGIDRANAETETKEKQLEVKKEALAKQKEFNEQTLSAEHESALDSLAAREQQAQFELDAGFINQEQHLAKLKEFAAEKYQIEQDLFDKKLALLDKESVAYQQLLSEKTNLERDYALQKQDLLNKETLQQKQAFNEAFAPFSNALDQSINGILTGQQTVKNAVKNAAQSMLLSYAQTFLKQRVMALAQWAWEVAGFAGKETKKKGIEESGILWRAAKWAWEKVQLGAHWLWETLGFTSKETTQASVKVANEAVKTGAQLTGDALRTQSAVVSAETTKQAENSQAENSIMNSAAAAAGSVYESVSQIPLIGWLLAPIAAAATFVAVAGYKAVVGSAKGGEWSVGEDGSPYMLHEKESVLPAGVAENFRKVVQIVQTNVQGEPLDIAASVKKALLNGTLANHLTIAPQFAGIPEKTEKTAFSRAKEFSAATGTLSAAKSGKQTLINLDGKLMTAEEFFTSNSHLIVKSGKKEARKLNGRVA